jgi:tnp2 family transposase
VLIGPYFESRLEEKDPITLLAAFVIIVLNVFGGLVREWASTALKLQMELLALSFGGRRRIISANNQELLDSFPRDIRTARKIFDLEATTKAYAACPGCSALYPVEEAKQLPAHCNRRRYPNANPCGTRLTKLVVQYCNGERKMMRAPIQPFLIQDFDAFKASFLSRPGMEAILDRGTLFNDMNDMWDIKDGVGVKEMLGPDGEPFVDGLKRKELRLLWSLSVDWFNPRGNKAAGKSVSTGSVVMACLNLPPSLRYKAENLFLAAVMPKEPSVEEVGNYMEPLVEMLDKSWKNGTKFAQTESSEHGRTERSMLAVLVADLPAARKINGVASHSAKEFLCLFCGLARTDINNLNRATWSKRRRDVIKKAAEDWRDAETAGKRKSLFKQTGVRWTPFWKLDYYDPTKMATIDVMHNLFLGLVQFHVREVLGVEDAQTEEDHPVTIKELENARKGVTALNLKTLNRSRVSVLKALCTENGIDISATRKLKKKHLVQLLTVSALKLSRQNHSHP